MAAEIAMSTTAVVDNKKSSYNRNWKRTITTAYSEKADRRAQMVVMVSPGPKIDGMRAFKDESEAKALLERFAGKTPLQAFPDETVRTIPRAVAIHCMDAPAQCELQFLRIEEWDATFPSTKDGASGGKSKD